MTAADLLTRLEQVKPISGGHIARCPAHDDQTASLSVSEGRDGRVLLHCHAHCSTRDIVAALGLDMTDLFPERDRGGLGEPTAIYDYRDERGELVYQSLRFPLKQDGKKTFLQRRPNPGGGWIWKMTGVRRLLYRLDKLQGTVAVFIVEGEKDADRLWSIGLPATTNSGGAGKWTTDHVKQLLDAGVKRVAVLPDNDEPGEAHGMQVARACDDAGLFVRRIPLPGLPYKGDVSDWLDAGHTKDELLAIVKAAPPFKGHVSVVVKPKLELTSLADLLQEPDDAVEWLVDDRIPGGSLVLLAGKPKAGKSTLARSLAYCIAAGEPWLGHHVIMGPVWYLALEDKRSEVRRHFRMMGATGQEPLWILVGEAPQNCIALLEERAAHEKPVLIIVDTLQRLIQAKDMNDYAEVTTKFSPLLKLCRETGAACCVLHHANKFGDGLDCILGSTALSGSVDNIFIMGRGEHDRTLQSIQRIGPDMESTIVTLDPDTGHCALAGTKRDAEMDRAAGLILEALREETDAQSERWIREHVETAPKMQAAALRMMLRRGWVYRKGEGKRGNPYLYGAVHRGDETRKTRNAQDSPRKPVYVPQAQQVSQENRAKNTPNSDPAPVQKQQMQTGAVSRVESTTYSGFHAQKPEKPESPVGTYIGTRTSTRTNSESITANVVFLVSGSGENGDETALRGGATHSSNETYSGFATPGEEEIDDSLFANPEDDEDAGIA